MEHAIQDFIKFKRIAVVGVPRGGKKFGNKIYNELKQRGYQVYAVNPQIEEIAGEPCCPNLTALKDKVDSVVVCVPPQKTEQVLQDAAQSGLRRVWLQQGAETPQLVEQAHKLGMDVVAGKCILMYAPPVKSFHNFHRFFVRLFGKL